jgi:hypothetical protein
MQAAPRIRFFFVMAVLAALCGAAGCGVWQRLAEKQQKMEEWQPPRIVTLEGVEKANNYMRGGLFWGLFDWGIQGSDHHPLALPVRDGDILVIQDENEGGNYHLYRDEDGQHLSFELDSASVRLDGRVVSLVLSEDNDAGEWLNNAKPADLAGLRLLVLEEADSTQFENVETPADLNPEVRLVLGEEGIIYATVPMRSRLWRIDESIDSDEDFLELVKEDLEYFLMSEVDSAKLTLLSELPGLRALCIAEGKEEWREPFPAVLEQLRNLNVFSITSFDLSFLRNLTGLQELYLIGCDSVTNVGDLSMLPQLGSVIFNSTVQNSQEIIALQELQALKWLGLPANISQEQFAALIDSHPDLVGLEIVECDSIRDLSPLTGLRQLEYLVMLTEDMDTKPLQSLTSLRYLVLPEKVFADTLEVVDRLEEALPQAMIVQGLSLQGAHACLATGWILSLVPVVAVGYVITRRWRGALLKR